MGQIDTRPKEIPRSPVRFVLAEAARRNRRMEKRLSSGDRTCVKGMSGVRVFGDNALPCQRKNGEIEAVGITSTHNLQLG
jgi:hypothetical protein